jgi:hypothetical protein
MAAHKDFSNAPSTGEALKDPKRAAEVKELLAGAVDLHVHSGPSVMPRILDHHDAMMDAAEYKFSAILFKDHFYPGMAHARMLEKLIPNTGVKLFSGVALNNATGGINPYTVDHCVKLGGKIVWMPTFSAKNHIAQSSGQAASFPKTAQKMLDPTPLTVLDANGRLTDETKACIDIIAEGDIILAGGHLHVTELFPLFEEAKKRGVKKMMVNHPPYVVGVGDEDMRQLVALDVYMEQECAMFVDGKGRQFEPDELARWIKIAGVDHTIICADLGMGGGPRPVEGFRHMVSLLLDLQFSAADIKKLISTNSKKLMNMAA